MQGLLRYVLTPCPSQLEQTISVELLNAGSGGWSFQDLLELLLPLTAGAMTHALEHLASLPSFAAAALCVFSLVEPSVISAGVPSPPTTLEVNVPSCTQDTVLAAGIGGCCAQMP